MAAVDRAAGEATLAPPKPLLWLPGAFELGCSQLALRDATLAARAAARARARGGGDDAGATVGDDAKAASAAKWLATNAIRGARVLGEPREAGADGQRQPEARGDRRSLGGR